MNARADQTNPASDAIANLAHEIWEQEGRPEGRALEHWLRAEKMLAESGTQQAEATSQPAASSTASSPKGQSPPVAPSNRGGGAAQTRSMRRSSR